MNHTANQNKSKNEAAYKRWVQSFTPLQIKQANHARDLLRQEAKKNGKKTIYAHIKDDRLVKMPQNQYSLFLKDRYDSGDMKGMTIVEAGKLVAREWKDVSPAEKRVSNQPVRAFDTMLMLKQAYTERHAIDHNRYVTEYKTVYGIDSPSVANGAPAAATA